MNQLYLLELEEPEGSQCNEEEVPEELEEQGLKLSQPLEQMEIYIHALNGSTGYRTLRVTGYHYKKPLHTRVGTSSSHNSIDPEVVTKLGCSVTPTTPQWVVAANGNEMKVDKVCKISWLLQGAEFSADFLLLPLGSYGVVLGLQWLLTLGDIKINFRKLTMEFIYKGRKHTLRGAGRQVQTSSAGKLAKILGNHSQLCMLQVMPAKGSKLQWYSLEAKDETEKDPGLLKLLDKFSELFAEPTQLPPARGVFDHRIELHKGTEPINKRPYRYPSVKKDVIELLV